MNEILTYRVLQAAIDAGVREWVVCPGSRNSSFVEALRVEERLTTYYFPEERSAAFFALGRSRLLKQPVAVVVTSGSAAGELLPAIMEAHYSGVPLLAITADRPRSFRGTGAPQSAEQVGLYSHYATTIDITGDVPCDLTHWKLRGPAHINLCLEEPQSQAPFQGKSLSIEAPAPKPKHGNTLRAKELLDRYFAQVSNPIAIVSGLESSARESVAQLLLALQMPAMLESSSGLREDPRLESLRIYHTDHSILAGAAAQGYPVDGVLRIGGVPTHRIWRDFEYAKDTFKVCALSENPYSGLSWTRGVACISIPEFLAEYKTPKTFHSPKAAAWLESEKEYNDVLQELFLEEPLAETSLLATLSNVIPTSANIFLGNSLPIREWDIAATHSLAHPNVLVSRGINGIDGQLSTFLGLCKPSVDNWALLGDLTALYDMAGYWVVRQLEEINFTVVIINNGGGMIFKRMYKYPEMLNSHNLSFEPLAKLWGLDYQRWDCEGKPSQQPKGQYKILEVVPDGESTARFWDKLAKRTSGSKKSDPNAFKGVAAG